MELNIFFAFVVAAVIMISLPGPSVLLTIAQSISKIDAVGVILRTDSFPFLETILYIASP